jgi:hypothetical protein
LASLTSLTSFISFTSSLPFPSFQFEIIHQNHLKMLAAERLEVWSSFLPSLPSFLGGAVKNNVDRHLMASICGKLTLITRFHPTDSM